MLASLRSDRWTTSPEQVDGLTGIRDPLYGGNRAYVALRPVDLNHLSRLVLSEAGLQSRKAQEAYARYLALGDGERGF